MYFIYRHILEIYNNLSPFIIIKITTNLWNNVNNKIYKIKIKNIKNIKCNEITINNKFVKSKKRNKLLKLLLIYIVRLG